MINVKLAYKKLKQMVYYEKTHLFLRQKLAIFESKNTFQYKLSEIEDVLSSPAPCKTAQFKRWLKSISFSVLPKGVSSRSETNQEHGTFVSNHTSENTYAITKVNYVFDGPIELHLIAVLWLMIAGAKLDSTLKDNCMGSRLHKIVGKANDNSRHLFRKYHEQYAKWRDDGIAKARALLLDHKQSVYIAALDLQEFYYRVQIDWRKLKPKITNKTSPFRGSFKTF